MKLSDLWVNCVLGDIATLGNGYAFKSDEYQKEGIPIIRISDINESVVDTINSKHIYQHEEFEKFTVGFGDILIAMSGATTGKFGIYKGSVKAYQNQRVGNLKLFSDTQINKLFVYYLLFSLKRRIEKDAYGGAQPNISSSKVEAMEMSLPPLAERHRIVAKTEELFSELDKGVENLKIAREQLKVYRQALLKHAFEGKLTADWREKNKDKLETAAALQQRIHSERAARHHQQFTDWEANGKPGSKPKAPKLLIPFTNQELSKLPELPESCAWVKFGEVFDIYVGSTPSRKREDFWNGSIAWVSSGEVAFCRIKDTKEKITKDGYASASTEIHPVGTILLTMIGEGKTRGQPAILDIEACHNQNTAAIRVIGTGFPSDYLYQYLAYQYEITRKIGSGNNQKALNKERVSDMTIPLCSTSEMLEIVNLIDEKLSITNQLDQTITTALQQSEALRQSILKKAFSGTLVAQDANDEPASVLLARIKAEKAAQMVTTKPRKTQKAQALIEPVKTNVISFPVKIPNISATDLHAGIIARAYQLHENSTHLAYYGHVKAEKISHLVEAHLGIDLERIPYKDAAGPNDYAHLKKVESRAVKSGWYTVSQPQNSRAYVFNRLKGFDALIDKTVHKLGDRLSEVDALLKLLLPMNTRQAEIVATLYAAWNNLLLLGQAPSDEDIVYESRENWHTDKLKIERERFFKALIWMREHQLVPMGKGRTVLRKCEQFEPYEVKHD